MLKLDREKVFGPDSGSEYMWCLHCERAYQREEFREVDGLQMCPYDDCDGDTVIDALDWNEIREDYPEYPAAPEKGKVYPM